MASLHPEELRQQLVRSCNMLGITPALIPEPEVLQRDLERISCRTLADVIAGLIAEHEPMLKAEADGTTVTVRELGGSCVMRVSVEATR